jgi:hypothetical protein
VRRLSGRSKVDGSILLNYGKIPQQRGFGTSAEYELNTINEKIQNEYEEGMRRTVEGPIAQ